MKRYSASHGRRPRAGTPGGVSLTMPKRGHQDHGCVWLTTSQSRSFYPSHKPAAGERGAPDWRIRSISCIRTLQVHEQECQLMRVFGLTGLAGARVPEGGIRWCRVGDRVGARSRWKRPFDFPILPWCQRGALRIIAAMTQGEVIRKILQHLKLTVDPPLIAPAHVQQEAFSWSSA